MASSRLRSVPDFSLEQRRRYVTITHAIPLCAAQFFLCMDLDVSDDAIHE